MKCLFGTAARLALVACLTSAPVSATLRVDDVLAIVRQQYPPLLAAWLQQDIANGRVRQAQGAFDPILSAQVAVRPMNYYDGANAELLLEQPFSQWGGSVYGGYRLSSGFLADYERKLRTADGGEAVIGLRLPLLRDGDFDKRRAAIGKAAVDRELANPFVLRQYLDFHRAARISYYKWVAAGKKLAVAEQVLRIAQERDDSLREKAEQGALAPIIQVDNQRLVVSRQISVLNARRAFEAAAIELSLFYRETNTGEPILAIRGQLPEQFDEAAPIDKLQLVSDRGRAAFRRPETRELDLLIAKAGIDRRLAKNNLKPNLDLAVEFNRAIGSNRPSDIDQAELTGLLKFSMPIGQNEAKGRLQAINAEVTRLEQQREFTRDRIFADANDAFSAVKAAYQALDQTDVNVSLARQLEEAENDKFQQGASDLLALQIREQATFDAQVLKIDALFAYFKALADYKAAVASDAPAHLLPGSP